MNELLTQALLRIKPNPARAQEVSERITAFLTHLNAALQENHLKARAILGGSFAKDTWLANEFDVDIFVQFEQPSHDMSDTLARILPPSARRVHGSRDYFQLTDEDIMYEIVPVLHITHASEAQNVTDVSPLHITWVQQAGNLKDDIRLAKQFLKAHRLYGAESYLQGFSGHVVDILTIHYGGFEQLLAAAAKWKDKTIIDPKGHYKSHVLHHLNTSKTLGPLVLVDPLDKTRNAAAAVGHDSFETFILAAKQFLRKPRLDAFTTAPFDLKTCQERASALCSLTLAPGKRDIQGNKLIKIYQCIKEALHEFDVIESNWEWTGHGTAYLWFLTKHMTLPSHREQEGPPTSMHEASTAFKRAHQDTYERDGKLYASVKREHSTLYAALVAIAASPYICQRCEDICILKPLA